MILNVYAYFNKMLNAFSNAQYDDHTPENVCIYIQRDIKQAFLKGEYEKIRYLDFYKLGTFNDETGEFENDKELLLNDILEGFSTLEEDQNELMDEYKKFNI